MKGIILFGHGPRNPNTSSPSNASATAWRRGSRSAVVEWVFSN